MNKISYLRRIGVENGDIAPTLENLKLLQKQHLLNVPFENLDIHWERLILLDVGKFYEKIVGEKRGGFCYELNGLFSELLKEIGYGAKIVSARVSNGKDFGAEYDHLAILTEIGGEEFLVDVGFGDFTAEPLRFILDEEQQDATGIFKITKYDDYFEVFKKHCNGWKSEYIFKNLKRDLPEFAGMCKFHQTSPESHFTRGKVCSVMTNEGRVTLTDKKFIETTKSLKNETDINSEAEFYQILERKFEIHKAF
ncbi:MAG: arylamine N-acetyltransferase [Pyrinomonadaceae bacterium]